ncbi:MAG: hypothetical protein HC875_24110 [Anaerolineales bacterium]|nr:hypothetical protein [Anaerolineales bacterium]
MSINVPIETAKHNLENLLGQLHPGETMTLIGSEGMPVAIVVSLKPTQEAETESISDWEAEWEALAEEIGRAWQGDKSAVEILVEMRR